MKQQIIPELDTRTPEEIFRELDRFVIGQKRAKRVMAIAAYNHLKRVDQVMQQGWTALRKSNVLLIGPTGVGKTHLARIMSQILDLPFVVVDASEYTEAGYYGKDVEVMVAELLHSTGMNSSLCERGIIFIDEIDKVARRSGGMRTGAGSRDIGGEGVQQALLKLLEGQRIFVPHNLTQHWNRHEFTEVDTSHILFVCAGTFTDIQGYLAPGSMGFSESDIAKRKRTRRISHKQLLEYGMLSELLGRIPVVAQLDALSANDLARILIEPPDAVFKEYRELLHIDGVKLEATPAAIREIARFAERRMVGARGLRAIIEEILHDLLFEAPDFRGKTVKIKPALVREKLDTFDSGMLEE